MAEAATDTKTDATTTTATTTVADKGATSTTTATSATKTDATKTAAATTTTADDKGAANGVWPEDWQQRIAGSDEKELKQIARYASPADIWKKARSLEARLSSGELKTALPKDAKPEEIAAWRKDNGIPEKPEAYDLKGIKIDKEDKAAVDYILKSAHDANFSVDQARAAVGTYKDIEKQRLDARVAKDEEQRISALDSLNQEWGTTFRRNVNMIEGLLSKFPESVRDAMKAARLPDGTAAFNSPDILKGFAALALELNPAAIIVPAAGGDLGKSAMEEYKDIQKMIREDRRGYDRDAGKQARFTQLIEYLRKNDLIDDAGNEIVQRKKAA